MGVTDCMHEFDELILKYDIQEDGCLIISWFRTGLTYELKHEVFTCSLDFV